MLKNSNFVSGAKRRDDEIFSTEMEVEEDAESLNSEWEDFEEISNNSVFGRVSTRERKTRKVRNKSRALVSITKFPSKKFDGYNPDTSLRLAWEIFKVKGVERRTRTDTLDCWVYLASPSINTNQVFASQY